MSKRNLSTSNYIVIALSICLLFSAGVLAKDSRQAEWDTCLTQANQAIIDGNYADAHASLDKALDTSRKFQTGDPRLGRLWHLIGDLYLREANYDLAKEYFERALTAQQKALGPEDLAVADALAGLGACCEKRGDHVRAELFLARAMEIWRKQLGPDHPRLLSALPAMATYATLDNDLPRAQKLYEQVISIENKSNAVDKNQVGASLNLLAGLLASRGQYKDAEPLAQKAVDILEKSGAQSIGCDSARENLAYIEHQLGKPAPVFSGSGNEAPAGSTGSETAAPSSAASPATRTDSSARGTTTRDAGTSNEKPVQPAAEKRIASEIPRTKLINPALRGDQKVSQVPAHQNAGTDTKAVLRTPETMAVTAIAKDFHPWELGSGNPATAAGTSAHAPGDGRIKYLSGGRLISQEDYKAMLLTNQAYEMIKTEKYRMAVEILNKALAQSPQLASAHTNLGLALIRLGENNQAIEHLKQAIAIDPGRPAPWINLASAFQISGQLRAALATTHEFLRRFPSSTHTAKVKDLAMHLEQEVNNQARVQKVVASAGSQSAGDYYPYVTQEGRLRWSPQRKVLKVYAGNGSTVKGFKKEYVGFLKEAFKQWADASQGAVAFEFVNKPDKADVECAWTADPERAASRAEGGETRLTYQHGLIEHAVISVLTCDPSPDSPLGPNQVRVACLHEIGHALGLSGHSPDSQDIMYCSIPLADVKPAISTRDSQTLKRVYAGDNAISFAESRTDV